MGSLDTENHFKHHTNGPLDHRRHGRSNGLLKVWGKNKYTSIDQLKSFSLKPSDAKKLINLFKIIIY